MQGALRPAILKPPVLAAIDLNQFACELAPRTGLVNPFQTLLAVNPQPIRDHPLAQRLPTESDPVQLAQLLGCQGRAETPMALVGFRGDGAHHLTRAAIRAPSRAFPRRRALCTNSKKPR